MVELNRAVAVGMATGPAAGLAIVDAIEATGKLKDYPQLAVVRADLLSRLGRSAEACAHYEHAAAMTDNDRERDLFLAHAAALRTNEASSPLTSDHS